MFLYNDPPLASLALLHCQLKKRWDRRIMTLVSY